ncbi:MAG TPA: aminoglycoside phosphotransferase family protein [Acidimicrobiales bacterium]|nr:aminoglycoside phosphotransferase family protein [Acidimicrobiales bacterium]
MTGGTVALVFAARDESGRDCVLKVLPALGEAEGDYAAERDVLLAGHGRAYVELLRHDDARQAFLLERLGPKMVDNGGSVDEWNDALCELLLVAWDIGLTPPPSLWTAARKCEWFVEFLPRKWREHGEPCARAVIDEAVGFAEARGAAFDADTAVVLHGDAHMWNALSDNHGGYKFIDPDPFVGERAADLAVPMREWSSELLVGGDPLAAAQRRCARLARATGCDPQAVWEWGTIERVSTALIGLGEPHKVGSMRDWFVVAEACLGASPAPD